MEVFNVHVCNDERIILKSETQMESLLKEIEDSQTVMIRWIEEDEEEEEPVKRSKVLITDGLMARIKDGRFVLESKHVPKTE